MHVQLVQALGEEQLEYWQPTQDPNAGNAGAFGGGLGGATIEGMAGHTAASALAGHEPPPPTKIPASVSPPTVASSGSSLAPGAVPSLPAAATPASPTVPVVLQAINADDRSPARTERIDLPAT
jgi:hypothetical protein